ncbi:hypothetical protein EUGRSUZ_H04891 [Eucalyptus grandis]|uniref:Uncharacterized protein n=2 Tax=Eucalyptus grandis TaxID=71139 RepID=A0ACC3JYG8_EUCGR|nr:hypothetical protein EUGRSUZ_H04891 [Eucalyptus grandis]
MNHAKQILFARMKHGFRFHEIQYCVIAAVPTRMCTMYKQANAICEKLKRRLQESNFIYQKRSWLPLH